jgi:hypothetical protein
VINLVHECYDEERSCRHEGFLCLALKAMPNLRKFRLSDEYGLHVFKTRQIMPLISSLHELEELDLKGMRRIQPWDQSLKADFTVCRRSFNPLNFLLEVMKQAF